jgi:hypothetical protein
VLAFVTGGKVKAVARVGGLPPRET